MKKLFSLSLALLCAIATFAHDFEADGIYYNITSHSLAEVSVTYMGSSYSSNTDRYTGDVVIPSSVSLAALGLQTGSIQSASWSGSWTESAEPGAYNDVKMTSNTIGNNGSTVARCTFRATGTIYFQCRYQGENNYDYLTVGGLDQTCSRTTFETTLKGTSGIWRSIMFTITDDEEHFVEFCYSKDGSGTTYPDCAEVYMYALSSDMLDFSVTSIGETAFFGCSGLTSITIPDGVTSIGYSAFENCSGLTSITIPNSVTSIGNYAFHSCSSLTSVTIPNSVTSIGEDAFSHCSGLTSVTIPNSVTSIGRSAFYGCSGLTSITIPNSVTSISYDAFYNCSGLTSITIPNSVTSIGNGAFSGCSNLTAILLEAGNTVYDSRNGCNAIIETASNTLIVGCKNTIIPNNVTSIGHYAFSGCSGLTSITIPESVTSIGRSAFNNCSGLTSITIPESVTSIGRSAFSGCSGLTSITIPESVTSIGNEAFGDCSGLTSITCLAQTPPSLGSYPFFGVNKTIPLNVPCGTSGDYFLANGWSEFTNIVEHCNSYIITTAVNNPLFGTVTEGGYYESDTQVTLTATPNSGYYFTQWSDGNTDNPRTIIVSENASYVAQFAKQVMGTIYSGNSTPQNNQSLQQFRTIRETYPNAIMIVDEEYEDDVDGEPNVVVRYMVGKNASHEYYECSNFILADRATGKSPDFYSPVDFYAMSGSYTRSIPTSASTGRTSTCCVPFELNSTIVPNITTGKLLTFAYYEPTYSNGVPTGNAYSYFTERSYIDAGMPCFIFTTEAFTLEATFNNTLIVGTPMENTNMYGTFYPQSFPGTIYGVSTTGTQLANAEGYSTGAFRSVVSLDYTDPFNGGSNHHSSSPAPERMEIVIIGEDGEPMQTGLTQTIGTNSTTLPTYTVDGKLIGSDTPKSGLYIESGKIVFINK